MSGNAITFIDPKVGKPYSVETVVEFWGVRTYSEVLRSMEMQNMLSLPAGQMYSYCAKCAPGEGHWKLPWDSLMTEGLDEPILVVPKPSNWPILTVRDAMSGNCVTDSFPPQKIALSRISSYLKYKGILTISETDAVVCRFGDAFHERHQYLHELNACSGDLLDVYPRIWWQLEGKPYQQRLKKKYKLLFAVKMRPGLRDQFGNENWDWSQVAPYERENATGNIPVEGYGYETLVDVLNRSIREGRLNAYWSYRIQYEDQAPFNPDPLLKGAYRAQYLFALDPKPGTIIPVTNEGMQPNY